MDNINDHYFFFKSLRNITTMIIQKTLIKFEYSVRNAFLQVNVFQNCIGKPSRNKQEKQKQDYKLLWIYNNKDVVTPTSSNCKIQSL